MAGDLIPPPSPAGRPDPDAGQGGAAPERDDLRERPAAPPPAGLGALGGGEAAPGPPEPAGDPAAVPAPYRARFGLITGALIGLAAAVIAIALLTTGDGGRGAAGGTPWSAWEPSASEGYDAATQIAEHVGREYRNDDGSQLVNVQAGPIQVRDVPLTPVVRGTGTGDDIRELDGSGLWYVLNGLGDRGSIARGRPSSKRLALVKREALELALYTFRHIGGVDYVIVVLPPPPAPADAEPAGTEEQPLTAMLFRPDQLRAQLAVPLEATLPAGPPKPRRITRREESVLTEFTTPSVFNATITQAQDGTGFLVLEKPVPVAEPRLEPEIPKDE